MEIRRHRLDVENKEIVICMEIRRHRLDVENKDVILHGIHRIQ
jgi:hypothetical protein